VTTGYLLDPFAFCFIQVIPLIIVLFPSAFESYAVLNQESAFRIEYYYIFHSFVGVGAGALHLRSTFFGRCRVSSFFRKGFLEIPREKVTDPYGVLPVTGVWTNARSLDSFDSV